MNCHLRTIACATLLAAAFLFACGGRQTMASKSAAAYDEARKKGLKVGADDAPAPVDHSTMDHSTMDHAQMPAVDHSKMDHSTPDHQKVDHSTMDHSTMDHSKMDHSTPPSPEHSHTAEMTHDEPPPAVPLAPPLTSAEIARVRPADTLKPDEFDAPKKERP